MKMAVDGGTLIIKDADNVQFTVIKSWNKMKWDKKTQTLRGAADLQHRPPPPGSGEPETAPPGRPGRRGPGAHQPGAGPLLQVPREDAPLRTPNQGG